MNIPNKFTIDYKKWRCGGSTHKDHNRVGQGHTQLRNIYGKMCCLGQVAEQCGVPTKELEHVPAPDVLPYVSRVFLPFLVDGCDRDIRTPLAQVAMKINDDITTTIRTKIKLLTKLFKENNIELEFINVPKRHQ